MEDVIVPATVTVDGKPVRFQIQVAEVAAAELPPGDPERDVGIFTKAFSFDDVTDSIQAVAGAMTKALSHIAPDEGEIEFGIDIGIESGKLTSLLVKGTASGTLKVRLLWKKANTGG